MKKLFVLITVVSAFLITSCNNTSNQNTENSNLEEEEWVEESPTSDELSEEELVDGHTSQNALDWAGTYEGTLPCADCPGIKIELTINSDQTFSMYQEYLERDVKGTETGTFSWDEGGNVVTLTTESGREDLYQVGENRLYRLDPEGNRVQGELADLYILEKTGDE